jgi:hypothetical protein
MTILIWTFRKRDRGYMDWTGLVQDRYRWWALVNMGNEPSGSIKYGEFLDQLRTS